MYTEKVEDLVHIPVDVEKSMIFSAKNLSMSVGNCELAAHLTIQKLMVEHKIPEQNVVIIPCNLGDFPKSSLKEGDDDHIAVGMFQKTETGEKEC
jgi:hypothetical protein